MAEMTIRLIPDPDTGKKNIIISLKSDADALPHEHEQQHRILADKLIQGGIVKAGELGKISVERIDDEKVPATPVSTPPQGEREAASTGH
jgi:hypothetical protein